MKKKRSVAILFIMLLLSFTSITFASDVKIYPGSSCKPINPSYNYALNGSGYLTNIDGVARTFSCPIITDYVLQNPNALQGLWVTVNEISPSGAVYCWVTSVTSLGVAFKSRGRDTSQGGLTELNIGSMVGAGNGVYDLRCSVPSGSQIFSYRVQER